MTFRVLTAEFAHETNTFSRLITDKQAFSDRYVLIGDEAIDEALLLIQRSTCLRNNEIAFVDC